MEVEREKHIHTVKLCLERGKYQSYLCLYE